MVDADVLGGLAALATAGLGFVAGRRLRSGRIDTSDAAQLWQEARDQRESLGRRVDSLERQLERALGERADLMSMVEELQRELDGVRGELVNVRFEGRQKDEQITHLRHENQRLAGRVDELERGQVARRAERPT
jgi:chromosome segregation ATPase